MAVEVLIHIFDQWEWFMPFCSDDFPEQYKRLCKRSLFLSLSLSSSRTDQLQQEESAFNIWTIVFSRDHSFIIYSFLLDQLVLEASSWMLNSCSNICSCFFPLYDSQYRVFSQADIKIFGTHQYPRPLICFTSSLMYQGTTICLVTKVSKEFFFTSLYNILYSYLIPIIYTQFYGFNYSYLMTIICIQFYGFKFLYIILMIKIFQVIISI